MLSLHFEAGFLAARLPEQPDERERIARVIAEALDDGFDGLGDGRSECLRAADAVLAALAARPTVPEEPDEGRKARLVEKSRALAAGEPCPSCGMRHADPLDLLEEPGA